MILSGSWSKVLAVVKSYRDGEYEFGIDKIVIMSIAGCTIDEANKMISVHSTNGSSVLVFLELRLKSYL